MKVKSQASCLALSFWASMAVMWMYTKFEGYQLVALNQHKN